MRRNITAVSLIISLIFALCAGSYAGAETVLPDKQVLADAKQAVVYISQKDYPSAAKLLGTRNMREIQRICEDGCPEMFRILPQEEISVCYSLPTGIFIAVPIAMPSSNDCKTIVFTLTDSFDFVYARVLPWIKVIEEYSMADGVVWNVEYLPGFGSIMD